MDLQEIATGLVRRLVDAGYETYFAGGWVRDHLLGTDRDDIDIATSASPEEVMSLFEHTVPVGVAFGVVIVVEGGHHFEVSSFRRDGLYVDGRRPETVEYATAREDVARRDFTINGMFYDPLTGDIHDFVGGRKDLELGLIRAIGSAHDRFVEDRLRMIRGVRLACRFQFSIESETEAAILANASTLLPAVAMERVWQELTKMWAYPHFDEALLLLHRLGLLSVIFPALKAVSIDELRRRVGCFPCFPEESPLIAYLLELFPEASLEGQLELVDYLKARRSDGKFVTLLGEGREMVERGGSCEPIDWVRYYAKAESQCCLEVIAARMSPEERKAFLLDHNNRRQALSRHVERIVTKKPLLTSGVLKDNGIAPGQVMGRLLREAERLSVDEDIDDVSVLLQQLKASSLWPQGGS